MSPFFLPPLRSMASLYKEPKWNVSSVIATQKGPKVELDEVSEWLMEREKEQNFSLSHLWGALTSSAIMKEVSYPNHAVTACLKAESKVDLKCFVLLLIRLSQINSLRKQRERP